MGRTVPGPDARRVPARDRGRPVVSAIVLTLRGCHMTSEEEFRQAFASLEVNEDFTEAVLTMRDGSRLCFRHCVGERRAKATGGGEVSLAGQLLPLIALF